MNWKDAWGVAITFACQFAFYPGVVLKYQPSFIPDFSWFVITVVTFASVCDTLGRYIGGKVDLVPKRHHLLASLIRAAIFTALYLILWWEVPISFFNSATFVILNLALSTTSCGYLATLGMKYGSDAETKD